MADNLNLIRRTLETKLKIYQAVNHKEWLAPKVHMTQPWLGRVLPVC